MSGEQLHKQFKEIITRNVRGGLDAGRLRTVLAEERFAEEEPWRAELLIAAYQNRLPADFKADPSSAHQTCLRHIELLCSQGCDPDQAAWAVEAWRSALFLQGERVWPLPSAAPMSACADTEAPEPSTAGIAAAFPTYARIASPAPCAAETAAELPSDVQPSCPNCGKELDSEGICCPLCGRIIRDDLTEGSEFTWGRYPQGADGEVRPIRWITVRRGRDGVLAISKYSYQEK